MKYLGDHVEAGLRAVGITPARVEAITRRPCGCCGRKAKLNAADRLAREKSKALAQNLFARLPCFVANPDSRQTLS